MNQSIVMNESIVRGIYSHVGEAKFNSLLNPRKGKPKKDTSDRPITEATIDLIAGLIKKHKNPTRRVIIAKSYLSGSTVSNAIRILFERGAIKKIKVNPDSGRTIAYSLSK